MGNWVLIGDEAIDLDCFSDLFIEKNFEKSRYKYIITCTYKSDKHDSIYLYFKTRKDAVNALKKAFEEHNQIKLNALYAPGGTIYNNAKKDFENKV